MDEINAAVKFEDLFDFSPESADRLSQEDKELPSVECAQQPSSCSTLSQQPIDGFTSHPGGQEQRASGGVFANSSDFKVERYHHRDDAFADFDALTGGVDPSLHPSPSSSGFNLSNSVPVTTAIWGSSVANSESSGNRKSSTKVTATGGGCRPEEYPQSPISPKSQTAFCSGGATTKSKRGRKPGQTNLKSDMKSKLERSRQSARECRARKKLRYQYLDDLILERERANITLREELLMLQKWCHELDLMGTMPDGLEKVMREYGEDLRANQYKAIGEGGSRC